MRPANRECEWERWIAESWHDQGVWGIRPWTQFCNARLPGTVFSGCCLPPGHDGEVHIVFTIDGLIVKRWTRSGIVQP